MNKGRFTSAKLKGKSYAERYGDKLESVKANRAKSFQNSVTYKESRKKIAEGIRIKRSGKTLEELYGKERAESIKKKITEARLKQACPRTGKKHSETAKEKMSEKHKLFLKNNPEATKEHSKKLKVRYSNLSLEAKEKIRLEASERFLKSTRYKSHSICKKIKYWYSHEEAMCESSYEYYYCLQLNLKKIAWEKNNKIRIPYERYKKDGRSFYIPDILIYQDISKSTLTEIIEVKPYEFLYNPKNRQSAYYLTTKLKKDALEAYCKEHGYKVGFVTEIDLDQTLIKNNPIYNENHANKKDYETALSVRKGRLLSVS